MSNIIDRQTVVISVNFFTLYGVNNPSIASIPMNLRFAADELVVKSISYHGAISPNQASVDISDVVQIWCDKTNDGILASFPNSGTLSIPVFLSLNNHCRLNNTFQTGNFVLQFQQTGSSVASCLPQPLISDQAAHCTFGVASITIEFLKLKNKDIY